ncbi:MAG: tetratricopeptide repeat protein [Bacteroidetes bacterium]|nr:tetratricopeptide repeat protein [Bacteroidota bacterium]
MKNFCKSGILLLLFLLLAGTSFSQEDSLIYYYSQSSTPLPERVKPLIKKLTAKDTLKIAWIASKIYIKENKVDYYDQVANRFYMVDDYDDAKRYYIRSLDVAKKTLDKKLIAKELSSLGDIYRLQDQNSMALNYLLQAVYLYKDLKDPEKMAHNIALIGDINRCVEHYQDALKYLNEALAICLEYKLKKDEGFCYSSIGGVYQIQKNYDHALSYYNKGIELSQSIGDTMRIIDFYYSIGDLLIEKGNYAEAHVNFNKAIELDKIVKDQYHIGFCYMGIAKSFLQEKKFDRSIEEGLRAYQIGVSMSSPGLRADVAEILYRAYSETGDFKNGFKYLKINYDLYDSVINTDKIKEQTQIELNYKNSYKEKQDSLLRSAQQKQKDILHEAELTQQRTWAIAGAIGLLMAIVVVVIVFRFYQKEKHSKEIINRQKILVDSKNKEIVDSINYARKIQQAIIPTVAEVKNVFPNTFVMLLPKDIVSGDFYWVTKTGEQAFFAVADCTGHGVPGGFMSMLGTALLNEIINEKNIYEPADILDMLKLKIIMALRQSENANESKDGMDIALIQVNLKTQELKFAGANNSLYLLRNNKLREIKGDKFPIGFDGRNDKQFSQQTINLESNDLLYMFTDGYPDQFGGPQGKKFKYKPLELRLTQIAPLSMDKQQQALLKIHEEWRGDLEQVDDICIAGIRIV